MRKCVKFSACFASAIRTDLSGANEEMLISYPNRLFNTFKMISQTDDLERCFQFVEAQKISKFHFKLMCVSKGFVGDSIEEKESLSEDACNDDVIVTPNYH